MPARMSAISSENTSRKIKCVGLQHNRRGSVDGLTWEILEKSLVSMSYTGADENFPHKICLFFVELSSDKLDKSWPMN